jgi:hypothetical protein
VHTDTVAASYVTLSSAKTTSIAEPAAVQNKQKYIKITKAYLFSPFAFETMGSINGADHEFISELGLRTSNSTEDPRETSSLFQRISVSLHRFNEIGLSNLFSLGEVRANKLRHT